MNKVGRNYGNWMKKEKKERKFFIPERYNGSYLKLDIQVP